MIIKVCGMREPDNIRAVEQLSIHWMGFIFWPRSSRYVATPPAYLPQRVKRVGVFVDADIASITEIFNAYRLDVLQLHGHEDPAFIRDLRAALQPAVPHIVKAFPVATRADIAATQPYEGLVDYFLFDTKGPAVGGNGTQYDWSILDAYQGSTPFLLSGGIDPDDALRVRTFRHPQLAGIDLNSRFETAPALKDVTLLKSFLTKL